MALTLAGTAAIVLTAASGAVAANLGILGASSSTGNVGTLDAQTVSQLATTSPPSSIDPVVVTVDQVVPVPVDEPGSQDPAPQGSQAPAPSGTSGGAPAVSTPPAPTVTTAPPATYHDDSHESEHEAEHEDHSSSSTSSTVDHSDD